MAIDWTPLKRLIERRERFLVTTHVRPDGDALGSEVGLVGILERLGKRVKVVNASPTPPRYDFLNQPPGLFGHFGVSVPPEELRDREALIILDLSSWSQLGPMADFVRDFPGAKLVIDHHVSEDDLGADVIKDVRAEATGTLVLDAARALGVPLDERIATGLLTAIAMDTGWFRHSNMRASTLRDAAELVEAGAPINAIYRWLFERNTPGRMKLMGRTLNGLSFDLDGRVAYAAVTRADFEETGAIPPETEDLIDTIAGIAGVQLAILFIEQPKGGIKMSLRSRDDLDCSILAARFGGGGHMAAAGATLPDPLDEALPVVIAAVRALKAEASDT